MTAKQLGTGHWALGKKMRAAFASMSVFAALAPAFALTLDYDPLRPSELKACDDQRYRGKDDPAQECYTQIFVDSHNDALRAQAVWAMGDLAAANVLFRQYVAMNPNTTLAR